MKIVFIITSLQTGGAEMMLHKLLKHLDRERFQPTVVCLTDDGPVGAKIRDLGVTVELLKMKPRSPTPRAFLELVGVLRRVRPELVHTWLYHADLIGGLAARVAGVPAIAWCIRSSSLPKGELVRYVIHACAILSWWVPHGIACCSEVARRVHSNIGYAPLLFEVIPNGFELEAFAPDLAARQAVRKELQLYPEHFVVGLVARFNPQKNHLGFIKAAATVYRSLPAARFVLAGEGCHEKNILLMDAIRAEGLDHAFRLLGVRFDVNRVMNAFDVLASASSYGEAFPNVLGEAMACGVPCVVTDVGDSALIVGSTGIAVQPLDMEGLANGILELLRAPPEARRARGRAARRRIEDSFAIERVVSSYERFYERLAARPCAT